MARILCAWEFGGGLGHLRRLAPIANALRAAGHEVQFAFRDAALLEPLARAGFEGFAAPLLRPRSSPDPSPASFSDILLNQGYEDVASLKGALRAWRGLLAASAPQAVVADYAPTALVAARAAGIAAVTIGSGFALPPLTDPLPALRPWTGVDVAHLRSLDARLVAAIGAAMEGAAQAPARARDIFEGSTHLLCTFPELDPFGPRDDAEYLGPQGDDTAGLEVGWSDGAGPRILAYLKPGDPRFNALLGALRGVAADTIVAAPGLGEAAARELSRPRLRVVPVAIQLAGLLERADLCVCHGGPGIAARSLVSGVPLAMLPLQLEQLLIAQRLHRSGTGEFFALDAPSPDFGPWLDSLLRRADLRAAARERMRAHRDFSYAAASERAAARIAQAAGG